MHSVLGIPAKLLRAWARTLVVALGAAALGPLVHGVHAEECEPRFVLHDEREHHFQAAPDVGAGLPTSDHCVACHFARASRGVAAWEPSGLISFGRGLLLAHADGDAVAVLTAAPLPARAPPA